MEHLYSPTLSPISQTVRTLIPVVVSGSQTEKEAAAEELLQLAKSQGGVRHVVVALRLVHISERSETTLIHFLWKLMRESSDLAASVVTAVLVSAGDVNARWISEATVVFMCNDACPKTAAKYVARVLRCCGHKDEVGVRKRCREVLDTLLHRYRIYSEVVDVVLESCDDPVSNVRREAYSCLRHLFPCNQVDTDRICSRVLFGCCGLDSIVVEPALEQLSCVLETCPQLANKVAVLLERGCTNNTVDVHVVALRQLPAILKMLPESTAARFVGILQRLRDMDPNSLVRAAVVLQMPAIAKACPAFAHELVATFIQEFSEPMPPDVKNEAVACFTDALDACPNMAKELANALLPYCTCDPDTEAGPNAIKNVAQFLKACPTHAEAFVEKLVNLGEHDTPEYHVAILKQILPAIAAVPRRATELVNVVVHISQTSIHKKPRIEALKLLPDLAKLFPKRSMEFESAALDVCMGGSDDWLLMGGAENIDAAIEAFPESADIFISALLTGSVHRKRENRALAMRFIPVAAKACPRRADDLIRRLLCGCVDVSSCVRVEALRQMCFAVKCHPPRAMVIVRHMLRCCSQNDLYSNFFAREQLPNVLKAVPDITVHLMSILIGVSPEDSDEKAAHLENTLGKESKRPNRGHVTTMPSRKRQKHDVDQ